MSKINFPGNPNNGASHRWKRRRRFNYSSSKGGWQAKGATPPTPSAPTLNTNTDLQDMNDATGLAAKMRGMAVMYNSYSDFPTEDIYTGSFAYARDTNELYVWTGASPANVGGGSADFSTTTLLYTLDNPNAYDTVASDLFGRAVDISNNYAIVGAVFEDDAGGANSGKAYIFNLSDGSLAYTLDNPNPYGTSASDYFGRVVSISDNYAIVGASHEDDASGNQSGKAYIFDLSDGSLAYTLDNPNPYGTSADDYFGLSVSISNNYAIVGAYGEDEAGVSPDFGDDSGKAYIFDLSDGSLAYTLDNPDAYGNVANDQFGRVVSISNNYAIVGAQAEDDASGASSGKAYIFNLSDGSLAYTLDNPNAYTSGGDFFGYSVDISNNYAIVGAVYEDDAGGVQSGKAYIFNLSDGSLAYTLDNPNPYGTSEEDRFSYTVSISDTYAIISAWNEDDASGNQSGKVYIFDLSDGSLAYTLDNPNPYGTSDTDRFGTSVAISDNYAIVSAPYEDEADGISSGKVYIFQGS